MLNLRFLLPEILLVGLGLAVLLLDLLIGPRRGRLLYQFGVVAVGLTLAALGWTAMSGASGQGQLWVLDPFGTMLKAGVLVTTFLCLLLSLGYGRLNEEHLGIFTALLLWATAGVMVMVSAVDWLLIFLAIELVSIASFVLAGFERANIKSSEGAIKYFLIGAFSSAVTVYGLSLFYGSTGTTQLLQTGPSTDPLYTLGLLFLLVGVGFKASMVPFHFWVPDAYEGAPTPVTAWLSVAPKIGALGLLMRVFGTLLPDAHLTMNVLFGLLALLTMTVGNLTAFFQTNVKRLLASSSIAQAGYMMIGFVAGGEMGQQGLLLYSLVYIFMNIGAFTIAIIVANEEGSYELDAYDGLSRRNLGLSLLMAFFLLSLAGIPPMAGFIGKYYIFAAAMKEQLYWLAVFGVLNSVASVYYYMKIAYRMFFVPAKTESPMPVGWYLGSSLAIAGAGVLFLGVFPEPLIEAVKFSAHFLP
jgi:NADH-quinone oxidoreductase subunit N